MAVTVAALTFFTGCEETHNGRVDVSGCRVARSSHVDIWQDALMAHYGPEWSLEGQIYNKPENKTKKTKMLDDLKLHPWT